MTVDTPLLVTFIVYIVATTLIGFIAYRATRNLSDYILGGRRLGSFVTAMSAGASDMSGWLLMGLPGAVFLSGLSEEDMGLLLDWMDKGGTTTIKEFSALSFDERKEILDFVGNFDVFFDLEVNGQKYLLVHAGINHFSRDKDLYEYDIDDFVWVRPDYEKAYFDDVYVISGHTPTQLIPGNPNPGYIYRKNNHIALDCGACFPKGRLAGICLETGEEFYSR